MKKSINKLLVVLSFLLSSTAFSQTIHKDYYDGRIYLKFKNENPFQEDIKNGLVASNQFIEYFKLKADYKIEKVKKPFFRAKSNDIKNIIEVHFSDKNKVYELIELLSNKPSIEYAEMVPIMRPTLAPNDLGSATGTNNQYYLHKIDAQSAWNYSIGNPNIKVAIVDDAVQTNHPDLASSIWVNTGEIAGNGIDDDNNGYIDDVNGFDVADDDNNPNPPTANFSHGTHVAGIVGAATDNNTGIASIGFNLKIVPVKSTNQESVITDAYAGLVYAADIGSDVVNMSWGGSGFSQTSQNIINYAYSQGCVLVAAAGNDDVSSVFYPAGYTNVISVASTTSTDAKSSFSNYGSWIDVSAPGSNIYSTIPFGGYGNKSGTSMASPLVAGLCGLMLSYNPSMTQMQVQNCLLNNTDNINSQNPNYINQLGSGRINALKAMQCVSGTLIASPIAQISSTGISFCPGSNVQFNAISNGGLPTSYLWYFPGGNPSTSTLANPVVSYSSLGNYNVALKLTNAFGSDSSFQANYVSINQSSPQVFWEENFEIASLNSVGWTTANPDNGITWNLFNTSGNTIGTKSAGMNIFNYQSSIGQRDGLISPSINFSNNNSIVLTFDHAHRRRVSTVRDSLIVYVSTDGGLTFPHRVYSNAETGQGNFATNSILNSNFIPNSSADWCFGGATSAICTTINLSQFDGFPDVKLKFETYNSGGNNMYIDNIKLTGICAPLLAATASFTQSQSLFCSGGAVQFNANASNNPSSYQWTFNGGTPATSNLANPIVVYNSPGVYDVELTVSNNAGANVYTTQNAITVNAIPLVPTISQQGNTLVCNEISPIYQWLYPSGSPIAGANAQTYNPPVNGIYKVRVTNNLDCSRNSDNFNFKFESPNSIDENWKSKLTFYPNPVKNVLNIDAPLNGYEVKLLNSLGQIVYQMPSAQEKVLRINTENLAKGLYFIQVNHPQFTTTEKIIISK